MKNILKLHEAIAVVLLSQKNRVATIDFIAGEINKRKLYLRKDEQPLPAYQVMQRTLLSKSQYHHLFEFKKPNTVKLK
jgi:hypothetical protein